MADILLIEDDSTLRQQLSAYLESQGYAVHSFGRAQSGLEHFRDDGCDLVLLDVYLPDERGTTVLKRMTESFQDHPPIIIITGHGDKQVAIDALKLGAFDFLEKPFATKDLKGAIDRGLSQKHSEILRFRSHFASMGESHLTPRESEVAQLAAQGLNNEGIAKQLNIGPETVKTHLSRAYRKFGVDNRVALSLRLRK